MSLGLVGRKRGMTRVFTDAGESVPVTVIEALPNRVTQVKTVETDGYRSVQIASGEKRPSRMSKALVGHYAKAKVATGDTLLEFRLAEGEGADLVAGADIKVDSFTAGQVVDVTGTTIGKGYAGVVNTLFYGDNCRMVYGDAQAVMVQMIEAVRGLSLPAAA